MASGEFVAPLYADLPSMPQDERRSIFGLHVAQEGRTWIGYRMLTQAGFDPDKHMLQFYPVDIMPRWRTFFFDSGGLVPNWDLRTSLEGLYAAGETLLTGTAGAAHACTTGRYAGRKAAEYALGAEEPKIDRKQVEREKTRVYAPVNRMSGMDWKELNIGICQIMQVYCGDIRNEESLKVGLKWLEELNGKEAETLFARNPHELARALESLNLITVAEMVMHASLARKSSSALLGFQRSDYPEIDPPQWHKWITTKLDGGKVKIGERPIDYWGPLKENYEAHCGL
jgi:succinate dehydrogenase/fumarate reductase flavoprotein subunit